MGTSCPGAEGACIANARSTILVVVAWAAINSCNYFPVYLAGWLRKSCGFSATVALALTAVYKLVQVFLTFPVSLVGDRIHLRISVVGHCSAYSHRLLQHPFPVVHDE